MSISQFLITSALETAAIFLMVVLAHELGHTAIALLYRRRLFSIRILNVMLRIRKRRGKDGRYVMRFNIVKRRAGEHGEVSSAKPRSRSEDFVVSIAGLACEAALLWTLFHIAPWQTIDANNAWHLAVLLNVWFAGYVALSSAEPGNDLHYALRALEPKRRGRRRA
ncbi:MAG: hypothetical protein ABI446_06495 [Gemmatimonadaceae bacterium]